MQLIWPIAAVLAAAMVSPHAVAARDPDVFCGPEGGPHYRCGAILVILNEDTADTIVDVIERMGGDEADLLSEFTGIRDLLDPQGSVVDVSFTAVYQVAVPRGQEHEMAEAYRSDSAVYGAGVDRETIGSLTPNTAMPGPGAPPWSVLLGMSLLVVAAQRWCANRGRRGALPPS